MQGKDSTKAKELFATSESKYLELKSKLQAPIASNITHPLKEYIPGLDSTQTAMQFLQQAGSKFGLSSDKLQQVSAISTQVQQLEGRLQQANDIQTFIKEREQELKDKLANTGLGKQLLSINKEVYYYQQRLAEYKALLNNKKQLEEKVLTTLTQLPVFQNFIQKHSYLAQLFPMPNNYGAPQALAGLQTRTQVQNILNQRISAGGGAGGSNPQAYIQQQVQSAQDQMSQLKDKISELGGCGSSDMTMPDFKPNSQKTKTFLQRFEYGFNIQSEKGTGFLPVTSDIALTLGYKPNDKAVIGVGIAYKLGWGSGWNHIKLSNQGVGLRSYVDIKIPSPVGGVGGGFWISGGFEYNYMQAFAKLSDIKNLDIWQKSALMGLTKKYKVGKKTGNLQLLYDFLSNQQVPRGQALKFRVGWLF